MRKMIWAVIAVAVLAGVAVGVRYENRVSLEFRSQLVILNAAIKEQQDHQQREMRRSLTEQELETDQLAVRNDRLEIQIAQLKGRLADYAKLNGDQAKVDADEMSLRMDANVEMFSRDRYPNPDVVLAELPTHVKTLRDRYLIHRLDRAKVERDEATACYSTKDFSTGHHFPECEAFEKQAAADAQYVMAAAR